MKAYLYDPTGNMTLLVETPVPASERKSVAAELMAAEPQAEQLGFLCGGGEGYDIELQMAGGEFCGNATMSAAAHFALAQGLESGWVTVKVSGTPETVRVQVERGCESTDFLIGSVFMPLPIGIEELTLDGYTLPLVRMNGISHLISDGVLSRNEAKDAIRRWCKELGCDCLGIMLYEREHRRLVPLVYVPAVDTLFWETSCASGTAATGAWMQWKAGAGINTNFIEPGGILHVEADGQRLVLRGTVRLEKEIER